MQPEERAHVSRCHVFGHHGDEQELVIATFEPDVPVERKRTNSDRIPITDVMTHDVICARPDLELSALARLMVDKHIGCVPIVDERGRPQGIVTKFDLIEQLDPQVPGPPRTAVDAMMPLAITLDERATLAHAASMMTLEDLHHVMVVGGSGRLIGVVSSKDIVRWLVDNDELTGS